MSDPEAAPASEKPTGETQAAGPSESKPERKRDRSAGNRGPATRKNSGKSRPAAAKVPEASPFDEDPFGGNPEPFPAGSPHPRSRTTAGSGSTAWVVLALLAIALGIGGYLALNSGSAPSTKSSRPTFLAADGSYELRSPGPEWKRTEDVPFPGRRPELVLRRGSAPIWIALSRSQAVPLAGWEQSRTANWNEDIGPLEATASQQSSLAGMAGRRLSARGSRDGRAVRRSALAAVYGGTLFELVFEAPADEYDETVAAFSKVGDEFEIRRDSAGAPSAAESESPSPGGHEQMFASERFGYRIRVPSSGGWRSNPELISTSRFDDLKLVDGTLDASIIVAATNEAPSSEAWKDLYLSHRDLLWERTETLGPVERIEIAGLRGIRIRLLVGGVEGSYLLWATFLEGSERHYRIECRCPFARRGEYEPIFDRATRSFVETKTPVAIARSDSKETSPEPRTEAEEPERPADETRSEPMVRVEPPENFERMRKRPSLDDLD